MNGFSIIALTDSLRLAPLADGKIVSREAIEKLLRDSVFDNEADISDDSLSVMSMFLIFADFSDRLGRFLGHEIASDGMALDWADDYPHLNKVCMDIQIIVVETMSAISDEFRKISGFGIGEVFVKMINDDTTPEIASAQLELERQQITIH